MHAGVLCVGDGVRCLEACLNAALRAGQNSCAPGRDEPPHAGAATNRADSLYALRYRTAFAALVNDQQPLCAQVHCACSAAARQHFGIRNLFTFRSLVFGGGLPKSSSIRRFGRDSLPTKFTLDENWEPKVSLSEIFGREILAEGAMEVR